MIKASDQERTGLRRIELSGARRDVDEIEAPSKNIKKTDANHVERRANRSHYQRRRRYNNKLERR